MGFRLSTSASDLSALELAFCSYVLRSLQELKLKDPFPYATRLAGRALNYFRTPRFWSYMYISWDDHTHETHGPLV